MEFYNLQFGTWRMYAYDIQMYSNTPECMKDTCILVRSSMIIGRGSVSPQQHKRFGENAQWQNEQ